MNRVNTVQADGKQVIAKVSHYTMIAQPDGDQIGFCVSEAGTGTKKFTLLLITLNKYFVFP